MIIRSFCLTLHKIRDLEAILRKGGLSLKDCKVAVAAVKSWLPRDAEVPETTPRDSVVPEGAHHPSEHNYESEAQKPDLDLRGLQ